MKKALVATKDSLVSKIEAVLASRSAIDEEALDELEGTLLGADLGVQVTERIMNAIRLQHKKDLIRRPMKRKRKSKAAPFHSQSAVTCRGAGARRRIAGLDGGGVNGTGKTTTVGKLASRVSGEGKKCLYVPPIPSVLRNRAACCLGGTFWCRADQKQDGRGPSAVLHDALAAATARAATLLSSIRPADCTPKAI